MLKKISSAFTGGVIGGLISCIILWILGHAAVTAMLHIHLKPKFTTAWLYPRLITSGAWALLLVLPVLKSRLALRGVLLSLFPSAMMLFWIFPRIGQGRYGLSLGILAPVLIVALNIIYGIVASLWYHHSAR